MFSEKTIEGKLFSSDFSMFCLLSHPTDLKGVRGEHMWFGNCLSLSRFTTASADIANSQSELTAVLCKVKE